jgi:hypothetical protein
VSIPRKIGRVAAAWYVLVSFGAAAILGQEAESKSVAKPAEKAAATEKAPETAAGKAPIPFQIQLLETHIRFEANGDSRKDVHTIVKINDLLGAREFARLAFDFNRAYQQVEIPMVRVTHANGGTSEVLPSAITDAANPAVEKYPAYQDVRVKAVRILGLQEGDAIEYRVITTTMHHPLAPDFWVEHTFDRSGQVLEENYELDLPGARNVLLKMRDGLEPPKTESVDKAPNSRKIYRWFLTSKESEKLDQSVDPKKSDLTLTTFDDWGVLSRKIAHLFEPRVGKDNSWLIEKSVTARAEELTKDSVSVPAKLAAIYYFVAQEIKTVDLPLGATGFRTRTESDILATGYAVAEDKFRLFAALARPYGLAAEAFLLGDSAEYWEQVARPSPFNYLLIRERYNSGCANCERPTFWLDPSLEVATFGMILARFRGRDALLLDDFYQGDTALARWERVSNKLPFAAIQKVGVNALLGKDGNLTAKVKYTLRGDNELLLRVAFHKTAKEKWKDVAGLLALSDGFRGVITSATASDPMATKQPFTVEYELKQAKFVDWAKKPVRIPALLPQIGLPDASTKSPGGGIELGTPLDVETTETLHLPLGTTVQAPAGTMVQRDYATYTSKYGATSGTLTAYRHIHFVRREVAADRVVDYGAFVQAVQNDQAQYFVLERGAEVKAAEK